MGTGEQEKEKMREEKIPFIVIEGKNAGRAVQASKIQDRMGEYYVWEMPEANQNVDTLKKMNYIGGEAVVIGDTKVWTNSDVVKRSIRGELERIILYQRHWHRFRILENVQSLYSLVPKVSQAERRFFSHVSLIFFLCSLAWKIGQAKRKSFPPGDHFLIVYLFLIRYLF